VSACATGRVPTPHTDAVDLHNARHTSHDGGGSRGSEFATRLSTTAHGLLSVGTAPLSTARLLGRVVLWLRAAAAAAEACGGDDDLKEASPLVSRATRGVFTEEIVAWRYYFATIIFAISR
jgi:hypothetical protein